MHERILARAKSKFRLHSFGKLLLVFTIIGFGVDCRALYSEENISISQIVTCLESFNQAASESFNDRAVPGNWQTRCTPILAKLNRFSKDKHSESFVEIYMSALNSNLNLQSESVLNYESVDAFNSAVAQRNPQISLDLTGQFNAQYFSQCSQNEDIQVGIACVTVEGLTPINNPFSYYQIGSNDVPVLNLSYDLINNQQDMLIQSAALTVKQKRSNTIQARKNVVKDVLNASDLLAIAMQKLLVRESVVSLYAQSERTVNSQMRARFITRVDLERVRSQLEKSKQDRDVALENVNIAFASLNNLLSEITEPGQTHGLFLSNPFIDVYELSYDQLVASVLQLSPDINALRFEADAFGYDSSAALRSIWPKLKASIGYSPEVASSIKGNSSIWQSGISQIGATLGLTWTIFDSGLARSQADGYQKKKKSTLLKLEQLTLKKLNLLDQLYKNIGAGNQQIKHSQESVNQLSMALIGSEQRLNAGFEDVTSLIQTVEIFTQAQMQYITALQDQNKRYRDLAFTTNYYGQTTISDEIMKINW